MAVTPEKRNHAVSALEVRTQIQSRKFSLPAPLLCGWCVLRDAGQTPGKLRPIYGAKPERMTTQQLGHCGFGNGEWNCNLEGGSGLFSGVEEEFAAVVLDDPLRDG